MIERLQSPAILLIHNKETEYGFLSGIAFVNDNYQKGAIAVDMNSRRKYRIESDIKPGIYYQQEINALPIQEIAHQPSPS